MRNYDVGQRLFKLIPKKKVGFTLMVFINEQ